jgi:solute carrier family 29 (equilibrative nucleoside transporter), member 1/2/3
MLCLALLTCLLTMSTFVHLSEGAFVTYTIGTGIVLAAAGAYLQTSVLAMASLFGPTVLQSLMSGQALVAVILSTVQLISATSSLHTSNADPADGVAETKSARLFFGIAALFLFLCGVANAWMTRLPSFRAVVPIDGGEPWMRRRLSVSADTRSPVIGGPHNSASDSKALWDRILAIAHRNITYEFAIAYVLMVTLVSSYRDSSRSEADVDLCGVPYSLSIPPSRYRLFPPIPRHTHCYSARSISSCSM